MKLFATSTRALVMEWLRGPDLPIEEDEEIIYSAFGRYLYDTNLLAYYFRLGRFRCVWYVLKKETKGAVVLPFRRVK